MNLYYYWVLFKVKLKIKLKGAKKMFKSLFIVMLAFGILSQIAFNSVCSYVDEEVATFEQLTEYAQSRGWNE